MTTELTLELIRNIVSTDLSDFDKLSAIEDILMDEEGVNK